MMCKWTFKIAKWMRIFFFRSFYDNKCNYLKMDQNALFVVGNFPLWLCDNRYYSPVIVG